MCSEWNSSLATDIVLTGRALDRAFPFHLAFARDMALLQAGSALRRVLPALEVGEGADLRRHFRVVRPAVEPSFETLGDTGGALVVLESMRGLRLQGQIECLPGDILLFLCSPVATDAQSLARFGLRFEDFPAYDSIGDFLLLLQSTKTNVADLERTMAALRTEREQLKTTQLRLEDALRANKATLQALGRSEREYRAVVETVKEVVFRTDTEGRWRLLNRAWTDILGYPVEATLGRVFLEFVHPDDRDANVEAFRPLVAGEKPFCRHEVRYLTQDGQIRWMDVFARLEFDEGGAAIGTAGTLDDVTLQRASLQSLEDSARQMRAAKDLAEAASRAKSEFVASMSHEVRTPLHTMLGMSELMLSTRLTAEQQHLMGVIQASTNQLQYLVDGVLDVAKIEQGRTEINPAAFDPWEKIEEAATYTAARAAQAVDVVLAIDPAVPRSIETDPARVGQILFNLTSNAAKFTKAGEIVISAAFEDRRDGDGLLRLSVADTGPGIPSAEQDFVLERFRQGREGLRVGGTGLGLHITREIVERLGGTVTFTSAEHEGSCFTATVPCRAAEPPIRIPFLTVGARSLVAIPSPSLRAAVAAHLTAAGCDVDAVGSAADLPAGAVSRPFDCAIVHERLYASFAGRVTGPIVVVTSRWVQSAVPGARMVTTPVRWAALAEALSPRGSSESSGLPARGDAVDAPARVLLVDDNPAGLDFGQRVLSRAGHAVDVAGDGSAALAAATSQVYDVILMDLQMPDTSGFEVTARIRAVERQLGRDPVPIVALTAHAMDSVAESCRLAGMDGYLTKPISVPGLLEAVARWGRRCTHAQPGDVTDLVPGYVRSRRDDLDECRAALASGDFGLIRSIAHNIKGTGSSYGFPELTRIAAKIEGAAGACAREEVEVGLEDIARLLDDARRRVPHV